jgi:hypothetical protein
VPKNRDFTVHGTEKTPDLWCQNSAPLCTNIWSVLTWLTTLLRSERAIARWIGSQLEAARAAHKTIRIEDLVQEAAEKFGKSDVTVRRAWQRFGRHERRRTLK